jgi:ribosomal protein L32
VASKGDEVVDNLWSDWYASEFALEVNELLSTTKLELSTSKEWRGKGKVHIQTHLRLRPFGSLESWLAAGLLQMILLKRPVKKCQHCGKYFLTSDNRRYRYCRDGCKERASTARKAMRRSGLYGRPTVDLSVQAP